MSLSIVTTCFGAALVAFVLVGGLAADRINQRRIIIAVETVNVLASSAIAVLGVLGALQIWHLAVGCSGVGNRGGFLLSRVQRAPAQDSAGRTAAGGQRRRGRGPPGIPAGRRPCGRRPDRGRDLPVAGCCRGGGAVRRGPAALGRDPARDGNACARTGAGAATPAARPARGLRVHAAHAVAAVDTAVRQLDGAVGARTDRGAAAVHRQATLRRRREDIRLHPGVLRRWAARWARSPCRRAGCLVAI